MISQIRNELEALGVRQFPNSLKLDPQGTFRRGALITVFRSASRRPISI